MDILSIMSERYHILSDYPEIDLSNFEYSPATSCPDNPTATRMTVRDVVWEPEQEDNQLKKIYIKTPHMKIGHVDQYRDLNYLDLNFQSQHRRNQDFRDFVNIMDIHHIAQIHGQPGIWGFDPTVPMSEIEYLYVPTVKKSGYTFDDCLKLRFKPDDRVKIYDQYGNKVSWGHLDADYPVQALLYLDGIRFENGQFHTDWRPIQLRVRVPEHVLSQMGGAEFEPDEEETDTGYDADEADETEAVQELEETTETARESMGSNSHMPVEAIVDGQEDVEATDNAAEDHEEIEIVSHEPEEVVESHGAVEETVADETVADETVEAEEADVESEPVADTKEKVSEVSTVDTAATIDVEGDDTGTEIVEIKLSQDEEK